MAHSKHSVIAKTYDRKGNLLSIAKNSYVKTHRVQAMYAQKAGEAEEAVFLHAEIAALLKARKPVYRIEIFRLNANGEPAPASPCAACKIAIKEFQVQVIVHT